MNMSNQVEISGIVGEAIQIRPCTCVQEREKYSMETDKNPHPVQCCGMRLCDCRLRGMKGIKLPSSICLKKQKNIGSHLPFLGPYQSVTPIFSI